MKQSVRNDFMYEKLNKYINSGMLQNIKLKALHKENRFKWYLFGLPYPLEPDRTYKESRVYVWNVRSCKLDFITALKECTNGECDSFKVLSCELKNCSPSFVNRIVSLTPAVITLEGKYWTKEDGIETAIQKLCSNANRKYEAYYQEKVDTKHQFIESVNQLNHMPIPIPYKKTKLVGNKFEIQVKSDTLSQRLAALILAAGVGEKGSIGMGYSLYK